MKKLTLLLLATSMISLTLSSCNTVRGVGRDVQHAGAHIEDAGRR